MRGESYFIVKKIGEDEDKNIYKIWTTPSQQEAYDIQKENEATFVIKGKQVFLKLKTVVEEQ